MQEQAQLAIVDLIQNNVLSYMKARKTKTNSEYQVAKDMHVSICMVHHSTSLKTFRNKFESLKQKGDL